MIVESKEKVLDLGLGSNDRGGKEGKRVEEDRDGKGGKSTANA